jgi:hypothetical protein
LLKYYIGLPLKYSSTYEVKLSQTSKTKFSILISLYLVSY